MHTNFFKRDVSRLRSVSVLKCIYFMLKKVKGDASHSRTVVGSVHTLKSRSFIICESLQRQFVLSIKILCGLTVINLDPCLTLCLAGCLNFRLLGLGSP